MSRLRYAGLTGSVGSSGLTNSATSHTFTAPLTFGNATSPSTVPSLTGTDDFVLSILDSSGNLSEIVRVTAYNSSTGVATIVRGQQGTSGVAHSSGDKVTQSAYPDDFAFIGCRVFNSANISVANGGAQLTFDSERFDTDGIHSTVTNTGRLTCQTAGKYRIGGSILFANNNNNMRGLQVLLNGATVIGIHRVPASPTGSTDTVGMAMDVVYDLAAGDFVELTAYQSSGIALNVISGAAYSPEFWMHRVGS